MTRIGRSVLLRDLRVLLHLLLLGEFLLIRELLLRYLWQLRDVILRGSVILGGRISQQRGLGGHQVFQEGAGA